MRFLSQYFYPQIVALSRIAIWRLNVVVSSECLHQGTAGDADADAYALQHSALPIQWQGIQKLGGDDPGQQAGRGVAFGNGLLWRCGRFDVGAANTKS